MASATMHRAAEAERGEVGLGDRDAHRVEVDAGRGEPGPGEGDQVAADAAAEVDHRARPATAASRAARCAATGGRVACSRPSGVKYIRPAQVAELRARPGAAASAWVSAAAAWLRVGVVRRSAARPRSGSPPRRRRPRRRARSALAVVGQQPAKASRSTRRILVQTPVGLAPRLALEC